MLSTDHRMRRREEFAAAVRGGRAGRATLVAHLAAGSGGTAGSSLPGGSGGSARAGFVVSKAVGTAVVRNRVKRRLRHLVAERIDRLPAGDLLVVRALPPAAEAPTAVLAADLDGALTKLLRQRREPGRERGRR